MEVEPVPGAQPRGLTVERTTVGDVVHWAIANDDRTTKPVDRVALRWHIRARGPVRVLRHGYQSWSASGGGRLGADSDPSRVPGSLELVRGMHHADAAVASEGELRSELVTVLADDDGAIAFGFDGGVRHDGTLRVRARSDGGAEVLAEAYLGGATLAPGSRRELHAVRVESGAPTTLLERWADWAGSASAARTSAPYQVGWCSWYQYFHAVTESDIRANLVRAADWPIDVFQLDDGYQAAIGDWLRRADTFPGPLDHLARDIAAADLAPGIWIAPFLAAPDSELVRAHPDWIVHHRSGRELVGMFNPQWGGGMWTLDTTHPAVLDHLERLARTLVEMGWRYLKLDFTYAPSLAAVDWHDPTRTPAERVRAGYDAIRRGAGDDTFILGCGAPLGSCIGAVDGMRIGPDVAPRWHLGGGAWRPPGYEDCEPATVNAFRNTLTRSFQHRRLWLNDPDCLMLRTEDTSLTEEQTRVWARVIALSGGLALISDDLSRLDAPARRLLEEVLDVGRRADAAARTGATPRCPDVLDRWTPTTLVAGTERITVDPVIGAHSL
jgi:alpha-galactosidase